MVDDGESGGIPAEQAGGITRRQALKRGAILGGGLVWAAPVVQVVGMRPALAGTVSPQCQFVMTPVAGPGEAPLPPGFVLCLTYSQAVCDCMDECGEDEDCIEVCLDSETPMVKIGPC